VIEHAPLGVVIHSARIRGSVIQSGGGGGLKCVPEGAFALLHAPVYSDYEDSTIGGSLIVRDLKSCYLGVARLHVGHNASFTDDTLADPDAIEILANRIAGNLRCTADSHVWDSAEDRTNPQGQLYPRTPQPNRVRGRRLGQCKLASPATPGASSGPGPF
jgi:hypothetical protein